MGKFADMAKQLLSHRGIDWYISEHGFEGRWQMAVRELQEAGDHELASELQAGGEIWTRFNDLLADRGDDNVSQEEHHAYFDALRLHEQRIRAMLKG